VIFILKSPTRMSNLANPEYGRMSNSVNRESGRMTDAQNVPALDGAAAALDVVARGIAFYSLVHLSGNIAV
jgi:hypothetical protein